MATDCPDIAAAAERAGARAIMTSGSHQSGTDRIAEAAASISADVYVNVQGDEPLVDPANVDALIEVFKKCRDAEMATLARPIINSDEFGNPNVVKVVCDVSGNALYFSRSPIPYFRSDGEDANLEDKFSLIPVLAHIGMYAFTRKALLAFTGLPRGGLEEAEKLEQLRALEAGWKIKVVKVESNSMGVDCPSDLHAVEEILKSRAIKAL